MKQNLSRLTFIIWLGLITLSLAPLALAQTPETVEVSPQSQVRQGNILVFLPIVMAAPAVKPNEWQAQTSGIRSDLTDLSCPNDLTCFALATDGSVIATVDGGNNWQIKRSRDGETYEGDISCPDPTHCFAVGNNGTIIMTNNGGNSWNKTMVGSEHLFSISCPDQNNCLAVGNNSQAVAIFNGGKNWKPFKLGTTPLFSVDCPTTTVCFMVGSGRVVSVINGVRGQLVNTGDYIHVGLSCPSVNQCLMVSNRLVGDNRSEGMVHAINNNVIEINNPIDVGTIDKLKDINCPGSDVTTCFIAVAGVDGKKGSIMVSTDSGHNWADEPLAVTDKPLYGVACPTTAKTCYAVGQGGVILAKKVTP